MNIIDTHAHLDHVENISEALKEADASGVEGIMAVGVDFESNRRNLEIKKNYSKPKIYVGLGIHPGDIKTEEVEESLEFIRENIAQAHAIGETGLDFWYKWVKKDDAKKDEQRTVFRMQLKIAREYNLPVIIHSRGAWQECLAMTKEEQIQKAVFHWYSGPVDVLAGIIEQGYYVSCTPSLAYSEPAQEAIKKAPIERVLIETDTPVYYRNKETGEGFKSGPKDVVNTLGLYAKFKGVAEADAVAIFNNNAKVLFNLD
ncbi:MAG: TatD family hydrolase [Candidatus Omnitrophica bacterium]|nr:TatD family hydrolase [Candidatus Omnitrophota bacterium]